MSTYYCINLEYINNNSSVSMLYQILYSNTLRQHSFYIEIKSMLDQYYKI